MLIMMNAYEHGNSETILPTELKFDECVLDSSRNNCIDFRKKK